MVYLNVSHPHTEYLKISEIPNTLKYLFSVSMVYLIVSHPHSNYIYV